MHVGMTNVLRVDILTDMITVEMKVNKTLYLGLSMVKAIKSEGFGDTSEVNITK